MSNTITTIANGGTGITAGPHHGLKTMITAANSVVGHGQVLSVANGVGSLNGGFAFAQPSTAAFINDLKLLLEVINDLPDEHPLGDLKHDMRMRRAFKRLGG